MGHELDQQERALGTWRLRIDESPDMPAKQLRAVSRALRIKRFEIEDLKRRLPGVVRRGARVDLLPIYERLLEANIRCALVRTGDSPKL